MIELNFLEHAVLEKLLAGECDLLGILRSQLRYIEVKHRELTGVGFFTYFSIPEGIDRINDRRRFVFGDVQAHILDLTFGAGFLLYVMDGALYMLEGYTYGESWPRSVDQFELKYDDGPTRDLGKISKIFTRTGFE